MSTKEQSIISLIKSNPELAFRQILKEHQQMIYWRIRKMVLDHDLANDLTQDTFIKVWKNLSRFEGKSALSSWIHRIAINTALSHLEKEKRQRAHMEQFEEPIVAGEQTITSELVTIKLLRALAVLPPKQRLIFSLKYFDEMKYDEISELTGNAVGGLKASYHLAVKKITEFLNED